MSDQATAFDALIEEFYQVWLRYHPAEAEAAGFRDYAGLLPAMDDDEIGALTSWLESLLVGLEELDYFSLDRDRQLEHQLVFRSAQIELQGIMEHDWRRRDPLRFLPLDAVFQLTLMPQESFHDDLVALLSRIPEYLRRARHHLSSAPGLVSPQSAQAAMMECQDGAAYLARLGDSPLVKHLCHDKVNVQALCDAAADAVGAYGHFLEQDLMPNTAGPWGCGRHDFERLMWQRHFLDLPVEDLEPIFAGVYAQVGDRLGKLAASLGISADPASVFSYLNALPRLSGESRWEAYRDENEALREFVDGRDLVLLPDRSLRIHGQPACPRYDRCDSFYQGVGDIDQGGVLYLSEDPGTGPDRGESRAWIRDRCVELGWTGRHLLASLAPPAARSRARLINASSSLHGAWLLYVRQLLQEQEYGTADDALLRLFHQLRSIRLAQIELSVHFRKTAYDDALIALSEYEPDLRRARRILLGLLQNPAEQAAAVIGWLLIMRVRDRPGAGDSALSLREFHQAVLGYGSVPVPLLITRAFGEDVWRETKEKFQS